MTTINVTEARKNLYNLVDLANESHETILISGKRGNAVLISEEDWSAINETLYLLSIPKMRESIKKGLETPVDDCDTDLDW
jgi:antitoxin YefM